MSEDDPAEQKRGGKKSNNKGNIIGLQISLASI